MMSQLFSPMKIGGLELSNRFVRSATYECMAGENGEVTEELLKLYSNLAKGEIGLIISGHCYVNQAGKAVPKQIGIHSDEMIPGLARLVREVHEQDGKVAFQLAHAGRQTKKRVTGQAPMGPSSRGRDPINFVKPRQMNEDDIQQAIMSFVRAAGRAVEAGADAIQLHGAHGYLINQFLSPYFNQRKDSWGGSDENRFRFLQNVILEVKKAVPEGIPILIKLSTTDHTPRPGITPELAAYYSGKLSQIGIDGVEVSSGSILYSFMNICRGEVPVNELLQIFPAWLRPVARIMMNRYVGKYDLVEGYHVEAAKTIKHVLNETPLFLVGGMRTRTYMENCLEKGYADLISMSRPFVREPFLVRRLKEGKTDQASCVSCNKCLAAIANVMPLRCYNRSE
jgi:2,4-dienoyl-CoA reductase-like NADH-dependent reductase (Old Yellow Enzyme family)